MSAWYSGTERDHQCAFASLVREGDTVIDVGANWGLHTLLLSQCVGRRGRVIAAEPEPRALSELVWHLNANKCDNVKVYRCAVGDRIGTGRFVASESAYTGICSGSGQFNRYRRSSSTIVCDESIRTAFA